MYRRLLVPVDLSEKASAAVRVAARLADPDGAEVILLHVIETIEDVPHDELEEFYGRLEGKARAAMDRLERAARAPEGVVFRQEITYGKRAREVVGWGESEEVDLIVAGSHRVDLEDPGDSWASLSYQIAILAQGSVLLVK